MKPKGFYFSSPLIGVGIFLITIIIGGYVAVENSRQLDVAKSLVSGDKLVFVGRAIDSDITNVWVQYVLQNIFDNYQPCPPPQSCPLATQISTKVNATVADSLDLVYFYAYDSYSDVLCSLVPNCVVPGKVWCGEISSCIGTPPVDCATKTAYVQPVVIGYCMTCMDRERADTSITINVKSRSRYLVEGGAVADMLC